MQPLEKKKIKRFQQNLLRWFEKNKRTFPWRETQDPYQVVLAEILLQKTNVEKVLPVYVALLEKYPTVESLADAEVSDLVELVRPLGLLYRARRMKRSAESVVQKHGGNFPREKKELRQLYGVGDYMTNAVRAFAYGEPVPIVDTNVIRIFDRVFGLKSARPRARTDRLRWEQIGKAVPRKLSREFNLALLDFAALVCTSRNPKCPKCPMKNFCKYYYETQLTGIKAV
jgi:A/G-specific adenine glycosylase